MARARRVRYDATDRGSEGCPGPDRAGRAGRASRSDARVRETFAQFVPVEPKKADTAVAKKRKIARSPGQPVRIARYGVFGSNTW